MSVVFAGPELNIVLSRPTFLKLRLLPMIAKSQLRRRPDKCVMHADVVLRLVA